jgi:hypothetical protein
VLGVLFERLGSIAGEVDRSNSPGAIEPVQGAANGKPVSASLDSDATVSGAVSSRWSSYVEEPDGFGVSKSGVKLDEPARTSLLPIVATREYRALASTGKSF